MAGLKDIKRRIKSVKNTKKITYAMKLVAAAKLKKAQDAVTASRVYTDALGEVLSDLSHEQGLSEFTHPLMEERKDVKKLRVLVIGGSRGLCGGYNTNVNKKVDSFYKELRETYPEAQIEALLIGKKVREQYKRLGWDYIRSYEDLPEDANLWPIDEICREAETAFVNGEIDSVYVIYTKFISAMKMTVESQKLLPMDDDSSLAAEEVSEEAETGGASFAPGMTLFEPSTEEVFGAVVPRIHRTNVRQGGLDAKASENGARMVAMDSATKNAGELCDKLTLKHNKLRQGAITAELLDIIGGSQSSD